MPSVRITEADINSLSKKLDEISDVLSADEKNLLMAVFKMASAVLSGTKPASSVGQTESAAVAGTTKGSAAMALTAPSLSAGFKEAFKPIMPGGLNPAGMDIDVHVGW